jgi:CO/xanthine dehydrogenase FAD-binding subunit
MDRITHDWIVQNVTKENINDPKMFLKFRKTIEVRYHVFGTAWTILHHSTYVGNDETIAYLLHVGANIDQRSDNGNTALHIACHANTPTSVIVLLLNAGADINTLNKADLTPFMLLSKVHAHRIFEIRRILIDRGAIIPKEGLERPEVKRFISDRNNCRRSVITFIGLFKYKLAINANNRDVMRLIGNHLWSLRMS